MGVTFNRYVVIGRMLYRRPRFGLRDWLSVPWSVVTTSSDKQLFLVAAGVAFFGMLALFPALAAAVSLFGMLASPELVGEGLTLAEPILPTEVFKLIDVQVVKLVYSPRDSLGLASIVSLLLALWSARAGVYAMMGGLSLITRSTQRRAYLMDMLLAYALTVLLIIVVGFSISLLVVVPTVMALIPPSPATALLVDLVRWGIALVVISAGIGVLYRYGPSRDARRVPLMTIGNILASALWIAVSYLFSMYLAAFSTYNQVYGSLGAVIALLMWFYLSAYVVLLGASVNAEIEARAERIIRRRNPSLGVAE